MASVTHAPLLDDEIDTPGKAPDGHNESAFFSENCAPSDIYDDIAEVSNIDKGDVAAADDISSTNDSSKQVDDESSELGQSQAPSQADSDVEQGGATAADNHDTDEADDDIPNWPDYDKHVFVLSSAGKPIYSRHGNEEKSVTMMGVMQALISFVERDKDHLRTFQAGDHTFAFLSRGPLLLVLVTQCGEPEPQLFIQLNYVFSQIVSVLTQKQLFKIFRDRPGYDLRRMLQGTEKHIDSIIDLMDRDPSFFLGAVRCLPMSSSIRDRIGSILMTHRNKDVVFAVLIADFQLISLMRPRNYSLQPQDIHLIFNLVNSSTSFQQAETWTPICLPKFNNEGFLYAHVSYLDDRCTSCLLLFSTDREAFPALSECRTNILKSLSSNGYLEAISKAVARSQYSMSNCPFSDMLSSTESDEVLGKVRHFLYKNKTTAQFTSPMMEAPYTLESQRKRLLRDYQLILHRMHRPSHPLTIYFSSQTRQTLLGWVTSSFELYACFDPLIQKSQAIDCALVLIRWMKKEEDKLFILNSLSF